MKWKKKTERGRLGTCKCNGLVLCLWPYHACYDTRSSSWLHRACVSRTKHVGTQAVLQEVWVFKKQRMWHEIHIHWMVLSQDKLYTFVIYMYTHIYNCFKSRIYLERGLNHKLIFRASFRHLSCHTIEEKARWAHFRKPTKSEENHCHFEAFLVLKGVTTETWFGMALDRIWPRDSPELNGKNMECNSFWNILFRFFLGFFSVFWAIRMVFAAFWHLDLSLDLRLV